MHYVYFPRKSMYDFWLKWSFYYNSVIIIQLQKTKQNKILMPLFWKVLPPEISPWAPFSWVAPPATPSPQTPRILLYLLWVSQDPLQVSTRIPRPPLFMVQCQKKLYSSWLALSFFFNNQELRKILFCWVFSCQILSYSGGLAAKSNW